MEHKTVYVNQDGVRRTMISDDDRPNEIRVYTEADMTSLVDNNKALAELHPKGSTNKLLARVPMTVYEKAVIEDWDEQDWQKWLNDPDNRAFRVWGGTV